MIVGRSILIAAVRRQQIVAVRYLLARAGHAPLCRGNPGFYMRAQVVAEKVLGLVPPIGYASLG
jgi:hypothetical protein